MNNGLKQLEFHRDTKIDEKINDNKKIRDIRSYFRNEFNEFVKKHDQSDTNVLAEESLKKAWTLATRLKSGRNSDSETSTDRESHLKTFRESSSDQTNKKTKADNTEDELSFIPTHTRNFKSSRITERSFRQGYGYRCIPVYDSLSVVEIDREKREIVSIHSSLIEKIENNSKEVSPEPRFEKEEIKNLIEKKTGVAFDSHIDLDPTLFYYFDSNDEKWRLVYITDVKKANSSEMVKDDVELDYMNMVDYIIDAHSGEIIGEKPCVRSLMALD